MILSEILSESHIYTILQQYPQVNSAVMSIHLKGLLAISHYFNGKWSWSYWNSTVRIVDLQWIVFNHSKMNIASSITTTRPSKETFATVFINELGVAVKTLLADTVEAKEHMWSILTLYTFSRLLPILGNQNVGDLNLYKKEHFCFFKWSRQTYRLWICLLQRFDIRCSSTHWL